MLLVLGLPAQGAPPSLQIQSSTTASPAVNNPGRQLQRQMQRNLPPACASVAAPPEEKAAAPNPGEPKFFIRQIEVFGITRLSQKQVRGIIQPYENKALSLSDINLLLESLTRAYVKKGYVTTRVYLPRQDIGKGVLRLQVVEGTLVSFSTTSIKPVPALNATQSFPAESSNEQVRSRASSRSPRPF